MIARIRQGAALLLAIGLASCGGPGEEPGDVPADTIAVAPDAPLVAATPAPSNYSLVVTNPMPHTMIVSMQHDGATHELGAVPANGEQTFTVPAAGGSTITLLARDEAETHTPTGALTLPTGDTYAVWRIE